MLIAGGLASTKYDGLMFAGLPDRSEAWIGKMWLPATSGRDRLAESDVAERRVAAEQDVGRPVGIRAGVERRDRLVQPQARGVVVARHRRRDRRGAAVGDRVVDRLRRRVADEVEARDGEREAADGADRRRVDDVAVGVRRDGLGRVDVARAVLVDAVEVRDQGGPAVVVAAVDGRSEHHIRWRVVHEVEIRVEGVVARHVERVDAEALRSAGRRVEGVADGDRRRRVARRRPGLVVVRARVDRAAGSRPSL